MQCWPPCLQHVYCWRLFECVPRFLDIAVWSAWIRPDFQAISQPNFVFYVCKVSVVPVLSFVPMSIFVPFVIPLRLVIFPVSRRPFWRLCIVQNLKPWLLPSFFVPSIKIAFQPCLTSSSKICKWLCSTSSALLLLNSVFSDAVLRISNAFQISASYNFRVTLLHPVAVRLVSKRHGASCDCLQKPRCTKNVN